MKYSEIPYTYDEAIKSHESEEQKDAIVSEPNSQSHNLMWDIVIKLLGYQIFKKKIMAGKVIFKTRLVANGSKQQFGTYSPMMKSSSFRSLVMLAAMSDWELIIMTQKQHTSMAV